MSLTRFCKLKEVKQRISNDFIKPELPYKLPMLATPTTHNYPLVGTSFDYLLRFYIQRHNQHCTKHHRWVCESAILMLADNIKLRRVTRSRIQIAKGKLKTYLITKELTEDLIKFTLYLARMDCFVRSGFGSKDLGNIDKNDITDLRNLIELVKPEMFKGSKIELNPTFRAGRLVGGADADLIIDDILIDIKTTTHFKFTSDYFNQLIGYYVLYYLSNNIKPIKYLGIYYARQGYLFKFPISETISDINFLEFTKWFVQHAKKQNYQSCKKA